MKIWIDGYSVHITVEGYNGKASKEQLCYFLNAMWCAIDGARQCGTEVAHVTADNFQRDIMREIDRIDPHFYEH